MIEYLFFFIFAIFVIFIIILIIQIVTLETENTKHNLTGNIQVGPLGDELNGGAGPRSLVTALNNKLILDSANNQLLNFSNRESVYSFNFASGTPCETSGYTKLIAGENQSNSLKLVYTSGTLNNKIYFVVNENKMHGDKVIYDIYKNFSGDLHHFNYYTVNIRVYDSSDKFITSQIFIIKSEIGNYGCLNPWPCTSNATFVDKCTKQ